MPSNRSKINNIFRIPLKISTKKEMGKGSFLSLPNTILSLRESDIKYLIQTAFLIKIVSKVFAGFTF